MNDESSSANDDTDFVEITIRNNKFCSKKTRLIQLIALTKLFHLILILFIRNLHHFIHMGFFICLGILIYRLFNIVEKEVVKVLKEFGLQYSTFYSFGRQKSIFVPSSNIHKVVINEIIYFVSWRWIKSILFHILSSLIYRIMYYLSCNFSQKKNFLIKSPSSYYLRYIVLKKFI